MKTSIADPGISEPVMVAENEFVLLGKRLGSTSLSLWDEKGNLIVKEVKVVRELSSSKSNSWGWLEHLLAAIGLVASMKWIYCIAKQKSEKSDAAKNAEGAEDKNPDDKKTEDCSRGGSANSGSPESENSEDKNGVAKTAAVENPESVKA